MFISLTELQNRMPHISFLLLVNTAISRKIVVHATIPKGIAGGFELTVFQRNL